MGCVCFRVFLVHSLWYQYTNRVFEPCPMCQTGCYTRKGQAKARGSRCRACDYRSRFGKDKEPGPMKKRTHRKKAGKSVKQWCGLLCACGFSHGHGYFDLVLIRSFLAHGPVLPVWTTCFFPGNGKAAVGSSLCWSQWTKSHLPGVMLWTCAEHWIDQPRGKVFLFAFNWFCHCWLLACFVFASSHLIFHVQASSSADPCVWKAKVGRWYLVQCLLVL